MKRIALPVGIVCLCWLTPPAGAELKPDVVPTSWELTFEYGAPSRIEVDLGQGPQTYWYVIYTVVNRTGQDVDFHPEITRVNEIETELPAEQVGESPQQASRIQVDPSMVGVHPSVYAAIKRRHAKTHPFMVTPVEAIGRLLQGKDNARTSVAVFPDLDRRVNKFTIYVSGLSGEQKKIRNPLYESARLKKSAEAEAAGGDAVAEYFVVRKTLALPYTLPGDASTRPQAQPMLGQVAWVMR